MRGILTGILVLVALAAVVKSNAAASRFAGLFTGAAGIAQRVLDPAVPAIPNLTATSN